MTESRAPQPLPSPAGRHDLSATADERRASGKAARKRAKRSALGYWNAEERGHDALETILAQNQTRVPELVPIRHQRMAISPWNYYRGAAAVMASDLASQPDSGLTVQLCGDAHVLNFGLWATPERNLLVRLARFRRDAAWPVRVGHQALRRQPRGSGAGEPDQAARQPMPRSPPAIEAYRTRMRRYTTMPELDIWYDGIHADSLDQLFRAS